MSVVIECPGCSRPVKVGDTCECGLTIPDGSETCITKLHKKPPTTWSRFHKDTDEDSFGSWGTIIRQNEGD